MAIKVTVITAEGTEPGVLVGNTIIVEPLPEQLTVMVSMTLFVDVDINDLEEAVDDPHTALGVPASYIIDDVVVGPLSMIQEAH